MDLRFSQLLLLPLGLYIVSLAQEGCVGVCVCVCWCAAVVYGDHDRPSCELPPTQSYLSHKNTHIKAKIEAKRAKNIFFFSSLKVVCPHHQSKYFMCNLKAM